MVGQCCIAGEIHTGTPAGRIARVHGLDCYVAEPEDSPPKGIIVILPDALGWTFNNNRVLADEYSKKGGFTVYLPEFMDGNAMSPRLIATFEAIMFARGLWGNLKKYLHLMLAMPSILLFTYFNRSAVVRPRLVSFFSALRTDPTTSSLPIGAAGFCWGGYWGVQLCHGTETAADGRQLLDCAYVAHPSLLTVPNDIEGIRVPMSFAVPTIDPQLPLDKAKQVEQILGALEKKSGGETEHEFVWYQDAHHGFAVRGSQTDPKESQMGLDAEQQALAWFAKQFGS